MSSASFCWDHAVLCLRLIQRLPHLLWRQRHLHLARAVAAAGASQGIDDGVDDRRGGANRAELADAFDAEGVIAAWRTCTKSRMPSARGIV